MTRPLLLLFLLVGCVREPLPVGVGVPTTAAGQSVQVEEPPPPPPPEEDADCNLSTKLLPGIPGSPGHLVASSRNPNGDSELALLMRQFVDDLRDARTLLEAVQPVKALLPVHRKMRCAWPTKPEERNAKFDGLAISYLAAVKAYDRKPAKDTYNGILAGCVACHSQSCGGPLEFIDGMKWQ